MNDLVQRAQQGDAQALNTLCTQLRPRIYRLALRIVGCPTQADDTTQDAMLRLLTHLPTYQPRPGVAFTNWAMTIAHNTAVSEWRRRRRQAIPWADLPDGAPRSLPDPTPTALATLLRAERHAQLHTHVLRLPARLRRAIQLRYDEELTYEQIVARTGRPMGTVKNDLHRGKNILQKSKKSLAG